MSRSWSGIWARPQCGSRDAASIQRTLSARSAGSPPIRYARAGLDAAGPSQVMLASGWVRGGVSPRWRAASSRTRASWAGRGPGGGVAESSTAQPSVRKRAIEPSASSTVSSVPSSRTSLTAGPADAAW